MAAELTSSVYQGRKRSLRTATDGARRRIHSAGARGGCGGCGAAPLRKPRAARAGGFTSPERAGGVGGAAQHPPLWFDDERLVLLFVAELALDALGVRAGREVADAHVEEALALG